MADIEASPLPQSGSLSAQTGVSLGFTDPPTPLPWLGDKKRPANLENARLIE